MSITNGDILKVVATLIWPDAGIAQNVFAAIIDDVGGPFDDADIVDDALAWVANMYANMVGLMSDEIDGSSVAVYVYDTINDDFDEVGTIGWTFAPTQTDAYLPRGVAGLLGFWTTDPDVIGKKYLPGLTESVNSDGLLTAPAVTAMLAFGLDWVLPFAGAVSTADWVPGIWSPTQKDLLWGSGSYSASNVPAYQRRRKRGVGA